MDSTNSEVQPEDKKPNPETITEKEKRKNYWEGYKEPIVVATILLFIATGFLYYEASRYGKDAKTSADASIKSANAAGNAVREQRLNDSLNRISQNRKDSLDGIQRELDYTRDTTNIKIAQKIFASSNKLY